MFLIDSKHKLVPFEILFNMLVLRRSQLNIFSIQMTCIHISQQLKCRKTNVKKSSFIIQIFKNVQNIDKKELKIQ